MPKLVHRPPLYRFHKARGLACVTLNGQTHYLGPYGSQESRDAYARLIDEWQLRKGRPAPPSARERRRAKAAKDAAAEPLPLMIVELADRFLAWAAGYYVARDGKPSNENTMYRSALRPVVRLYGRLPARRFRPQQLKAVREELVTKGWNRKTPTGQVLTGQYSRKVINGYLRRIKQVFGWGVEEELIPVGVHQRLLRVRALQRGKTSAKDRPKVRAVSDADVERTLPWLSPGVQALVKFQRLTGCRPSEACDLRPCDLNISCDPWIYVPAAHKTEHRDRERHIFVGPKAMDVLRPLLLRPAEAHCFDPRDSEKKRHRAQREARKTKVQPSQQTRGKASRARPPREAYDKNTYGRAVRRGIDRANRAEMNAAALEGREPKLIARWTPNMLRHARAT